MPARASGWLFEQFHAHLVYLQDANSALFLPNQFTAPAAIIQAFVNGTIVIWLLSRDLWIKAYSDDKEMSTIHDLVTNPSKINNTTFNMVNYNYQAALCQSQILIENNMLILGEPVCGGSSYTRFQLVPADFYNIIFVAFHSNAIGRHLHAYHMLHCIHLQYYLPGMYSYTKRMCNTCPGCALANPTKSKLSKLVYNFPIKVPFLVLFINAYFWGKHSSFDGSKVYLIACCGMTRFASMEPIQHANFKIFASELMKSSIVLWILPPHSCFGQGQQILWCLPQSPQPPAH
jgi:hypothetical protein